MNVIEQTAERIADGIHQNVLAPEYFTGPAWAGRVSPSTMEHGTQTMAHMKASFDGEIEFDSESLAFGRAYHCRMLELDRYREQYAIAQRCEATTEKGHRCTRMGGGMVEGQWLCGQHDGGGVSEVEALSAGEAATIDAMAKVMFRHPVVRLLRAQGGCEVSVAWTWHGTPCRTRLDKWSPSTPEILDLKTVRSADPRDIEKAIEEYGWGRAAEMRKDAVENLTGVRPFYTLIVQEKTTPYEVAAVNIGEETQRGARWEYRGIMARWSHCVKTGVYPGWADDFIELDAPAWKLREYNQLVPGEAV